MLQLFPNGGATVTVFVTLFCIAVGTAVAWCGGRCAMPDGHCLDISLFWRRSTAALVFRVGASFEVKLQTLVYDILPSTEGDGKRCSECVSRFHSSVSHFPFVPVPNKRPRFCGRKAIWSRARSRGIGQSPGEIKRREVSWTLTKKLAQKRSRAGRWCWAR